MRYRRFLADEEELILDQRRHVIGRAFEIFAATVISASLAYGYVAWPSAPRVIRLTFLYGVPAVLVFTAVRVALYRTHHLILTNERVLIRSGFIRRSTTDLQLSRLTTVSTHQRFRERMIRKGTIELSMRDAPDPIVLEDVRKPLVVARAMSAAIDARPGARSSVPVLARPVAADLIAKLKSLHQRGAITDQEFEERIRGLRAQ